MRQPRQAVRMITRWTKVIVAFRVRGRCIATDMEAGAMPVAGTWNARRRQAMEEYMCLSRAFVEEMLMEEEQGTRGTMFLISRLRGPAPCEVARGRCRARPRGAATSSEHGRPFAVKVFDLLPSRVLLRHMPVKGAS